MGRIIVSEFVSLDGVMEAPGGEPGHPHTGWVMRFQDEAQVQYKFEEVRACEALLLGRITYESFAGAWPQYEGEFAGLMNAMPKFVASTTLTALEWNNASLLQGDVPAAVAALKATIPGDILLNGSRMLAQTLQAHGLVDEYRLMVFPILLGSGARLFAESPDAAQLSLTAIHQLSNGVVELRYQPDDAK